jgi:hypothetical protein
MHQNWLSLWLAAGLFVPDGSAIAQVDRNGSFTGTASESNLTWSIVPSPRKPGAASHLYSVSALSATQAWAVGDRIEGEGSPLVYRLTGTRWRVVKTPTVLDAYLKDVAALSNADVWAVGYQEGDCYRVFTVVEHWNGSAWTKVTSPNPSNDPCFGANYLTGIAAVASNDVWSVGYQETNPGYGELIIHWDGNKWTAFPTHFGGYRWLVDVAALSGTDVWAVGYTFLATGYQGLIMHWDGSRWSDVTVPQLDEDYSLYALTVISASDIWAVGDLGYGAAPVTTHWNGVSWTVVDNPELGTTGASLKAVAALASDDVWAAGYAYADGEFQNLLEHWNGSGWSKVDVPGVNEAANQLYSLTGDKAGGLWAVGYFYPNDLSRPISTLVLHGVP